MRGLSRSQTLALVAFAAVLLAAAAAPAQRLPGTGNGEWRYLGGDAGHTRSSSLDQINGDNFSDLEVAWIWRSDNFGPNRDYFNRATPIYVDGVLYTIAAPRRQVVAMDPGTGETLWTFREPETVRHLRSPRQAYGKGVAYAEVNGRGVIFVTSPAFFLWALDAETGRPLENWGKAIPLEGFPQSGGLDLIPPLVEDWGRWQDRSASYDPGYGIPRELGMVTQLVAADRGERRRRRARRAPAELRPDAHRERAGRRDGGRRGDRGGALEVPHDPAPGRVRPRDVAQRRLGMVGRHVDVGAGVGRPGARSRLSGDERVDRPELRRPPAGRQPVRRLRPRARRAHRGAALALPDPPQRPVELRPADGTDPDGPDSGRAAHSGADPEHEAGARLRLQPGDRRADLADCGPGGHPDGGLRQLHVRPAAVSDPARAGRPHRPGRG